MGGCTDLGAREGECFFFFLCVVASWTCTPPVVFHPPAIPCSHDRWHDSEEHADDAEWGLYKVFSRQELSPEVLHDLFSDTALVHVRLFLAWRCRRQ